ncbi:hypothetical protein CRG98_001768 [Punica granatum]|uniref:Uncharacterized protein n=1 Tax=Punica granatum TaxID=22663 RepID=A0A2I0LAT8_PUNGR|nr:hypothetical protein CRG98_001768 [Punica granatum]
MELVLLLLLLLLLRPLPLSIIKFNPIISSEVPWSQASIGNSELGLDLQIMKWKSETLGSIGEIWGSGIGVKEEREDGVEGGGRR